MPNLEDLRYARQRAGELWTEVPRAGFFKIQLVKGGAWVPAVIFRPCPIEMQSPRRWQWIDRWPALQAMRDADSFGGLRETCDPEQVWMYGCEIDQAEFRHWLKTRQHIRLHEPNAVDANPYRKIDLSRAAPIGPRPR